MVLKVVKCLITFTFRHLRNSLLLCGNEASLTIMKQRHIDNISERIHDLQVKRSNVWKVQEVKHACTDGRFCLSELSFLS